MSRGQRSQWFLQVFVGILQMLKDFQYFALTIYCTRCLIQNCCLFSFCAFISHIKTSTKLLGDLKYYLNKIFLEGLIRSCVGYMSEGFSTWSQRRLFNCGGSFSRPCALTDLLSQIIQSPARSHFSLRACGLAGSIACNNVIKQKEIYTWLWKKKKKSIYFARGRWVSLCDLAMGQSRAI